MWLARSAIPPLVFLTVFVIHVRSPVMTSYDSRWSIYTAMSLIREGNTDLDEYAELVEREGYYGIDRIGGHLYGTYPLGPSLLALPFLVVLDRASRGADAADLDRRLRLDPGLHERIERFVASVVVAMTAALVYLTMLLAFHRRWLALLLAGTFAFGTSAWSTASRALWQHGPSMLMLTLALYVILLARRRSWLIPYAGLPAALSYVMRPTNALSAFFLSLFVLVRYRDYAWRYFLWSGTVVLPFLAFNLAVYGAVLSPYYLAGRVSLTGHFLEALAGTLISPARGLFVFSPVLLFSVAGAVSGLRATSSAGLDACLAGIVLAHWMAISAFVSWWGGHSYGPRLFSDVLPFLIYFLGRAIEGFSHLAGARRTAVPAVFVASLSVSVLIHHRGASSRQVYLWNGRPVDVDRQPSRLWDWADPQFLRGLGPARSGG